MVGYGGGDGEGRLRDIMELIFQANTVELGIRRKKPLWDVVKNYYNERKDQAVRRYQMLNDLRTEGYEHQESTIDTYRNYLYKAGYLDIIRRGVYICVREIPVDLSISDVKSEAYGGFDFNGNRRVESHHIRLEALPMKDMRLKVMKNRKKKKNFLDDDEFMV